MNRTALYPYRAIAIGIIKIRPMSELIYSADPGLLIGFHGCDESLCQDIVSGKKTLIASNNSWDWLGDGIYFWQNNYDRAWHYANHSHSSLKIKNPAVLGAVFSLGNCLDLTDKKFIDLVKMAFTSRVKEFMLQEREMPLNTNPSNHPHSNDKIIRRLDCSVIKAVHSIAHSAGRRPFDSVRALFPEGNQLYEGAGFREQTHIQVAIRNPNMIKGYFLPRREQPWSGIPASRPPYLMLSAS